MRKEHHLDGRVGRLEEVSRAGEARRLGQSLQSERSRNDGSFAQKLFSARAGVFPRAPQ